LPELPEVETMVRGIRSHVINRSIQNLVACPNTCKSISLNPPLTRLRELISGEQFIDVRRLGKRVVFHVSDGSHLVVEPRMTGLMLLKDPPDIEHLRLRWDFAEPAEFNSLWFWDRRGLGTVTRFEPGALQQKYETLGPDALEMTTALWKNSCLKTGRDIKVILLDQKVVAGIGNIYASEILHLAAVNPTRPANSLSAESLRKLAKAVRSVLMKAIECEGSTLGDGTYRNALNQNGSYQNEHRVYMREGTLCLTCQKGPIIRIVQAQRSTFFCPRCQSH
jgi:formamidopyrimidine-DNA glycosylase